MEQQSAPSFGKLVLGAVLGQLGCVLAWILVAVCTIAILTLLGPQIANTFSKVTNGLSGT